MYSDGVLTFPNVVFLLRTDLLYTA